MSFDPQIAAGTIVNNKELCTIFKCSPQGGMRRSRSTNTLVIISNHVESVYEDRWINDNLHYTGMGLEGDQRLDATQNKTLAESNSNGVGVHLFEVFKPQEYTYAGQMLLAGRPYKEQQPDQKGRQRFVWMFPLKLKEGKVPLISDVQLRKTIEKKEREARKLSDDELLKRASSSSRQVGSRQVTAKQYERSP
jgi:5-methylcytosine-specific restriction protein A